MSGETEDDFYKPRVGDVAQYNGFGRLYEIVRINPPGWAWFVRYGADRSNLKSGDKYYGSFEQWKVEWLTTWLIRQRAQT